MIRFPHNEMSTQDNIDGSSDKNIKIYHNGKLTLRIGGPKIYLRSNLSSISGNSDKAFKKA